MSPSVDKVTRIIRNLKNLIKQNSGEWLEKQPAWLGKKNGEVIAGNGLVYIRFHNNKEEVAVNTIAPQRPDIPVIVGRSRTLPKLWQVIQIRDAFNVPASGGAVPYHYQQHMFGAEDMVPIHRKQITQLTVIPLPSKGPFYVRVYGDVRLTSLGNKLITTQSMNLASYQPATGFKYVSIESNTSGVLSVHSGTGFSGAATVDKMPVPEAGKYTRAHVLLYATQTAIVDADISVPMPPDFNPLDVSTITHEHNLDDLLDVNAPAPEDNQVLTWDAYAEEWIAQDPTGGGGGAILLDDLLDVSVPAPEDGQVLTWNEYAEEWQAADSGGSATGMLDDLTSQIPAASDHFDLAAEASGNVLLFYNGVYQPPSFFTMDVDNLGLTTDFSPISGDTLVAVYGTGVFTTPTDSDAIHKSVSSELDDLTEKATPVAGDKLLLEDSAAGGAKKWVDAENFLPSAGGWELTLDEDGTSFTNFTGGSGSWSSDGSKIIQTGGGVDSLARYNTKLPLGALVFEAEVQCKTNTGDGQIGIATNYDGSSANHTIAVQFRTNENDLRVDRVGITAAASFSVTVDIDIWYTLRVVVFGQTVSVYFDGTLLGSAAVAVPDKNASYVGLFTSRVTGWFRNIRAWTMVLPS